MGESWFTAARIIRQASGIVKADPMGILLFALAGERFREEGGR